MDEIKTIYESIWREKNQHVSECLETDPPQRQSIEELNRIYNIICYDLESKFDAGDPFAVWMGIYGYTVLIKAFKDLKIDITLPPPKWILDELNRIAGEMLEFDTDGRYSQVLSNILKVDGNKKKTAAKKRRDAGTSLAARELLRKGGRRKDHVAVLANEFGINSRDVETIYDEVAKRSLQKRLKEEIRQLKQQIDLMEKK